MLNKNVIVLHIDPDIEKLIPSFLENRRQDVVIIRAALKRDEFETIETLGHNMRGSGAGYGFEAVSEIGERIEKAAKMKDSANIEKSAADLLSYLRHVKVVYG